MWVAEITAPDGWQTLRGRGDAATIGRDIDPTLIAKLKQGGRDGFP